MDYSREDWPWVVECVVSLWSLVISSTVTSSPWTPSPAPSGMLPAWLQMDASPGTSSRWGFVVINLFIVYIFLFIEYFGLTLSKSSIYKGMIHCSYKKNLVIVCINLLTHIDICALLQYIDIVLNNVSSVFSISIFFSLPPSSTLTPPPSGPQRYASYKTGFGERVDRSGVTLEECEDHVRKSGEPTMRSSREEHVNNMFNYYVYPPTTK